MTVACAINELEGSRTQFGERREPGTRSYKLTIGKLYVVYGLTFIKGFICYLICCDNELLPEFIPSACFEKANGALPPFFTSRIMDWNVPNGSGSLFISGEALTKEGGGYDELMEQNPSTIQEWKSFRQYVDAYETQILGTIL